MGGGGKTERNIVQALAVWAVQRSFASNDKSVRLNMPHKSVAVNFLLPNPDRDCGQGDPWGYGVLGSGCWACELTLLLLPGWGPHVVGQEQNCLSQLDVPAGDTCRFICVIRTNKGKFPKVPSA